MPDRARETPAEMQARMDAEGAAAAEDQRRLEQAIRDAGAARRAEAIAAQPAGSRVLVDHAASEWDASRLRGMFDTPALKRLDLDVQVASQDIAPGHVSVSAFVGTASGDPVAEIERTINIAGREVHHDSFFIERDWQGKGLAKDFLRASVREYDDAGIERVTVNAAGKNGKYTWARFGFDFQHADDVRAHQRTFYGELFRHARAAGVDFGEARSNDEITEVLRSEFPRTTARIDAAEHSWEFAGMELEEEGLSVDDFGKQAMLAGRGWNGQLDLDPASESRKVFDAYTR